MRQVPRRASELTWAAECYTVPMEVPLQPEKEARLAQIAAQKGLNPNELAQEVISRHLEDDTRFVEAVNVGLAAAQRGDFVDHEDVGKKLKQILRG